MTFHRLAAATAALALLTACSAETTVGGDLQTEFASDADAPRLGERMETEADEPEPEPTTSATQAAAPQPTAEPEPQPAPTAEPAPQQQVSLTVQIYSDTEGPSQFDPPRARVFAGSCISWTNVDAVARSVVADDGTFDSGPIDPGAEFIHCFDAPGNVNYHDGTRPYAVASVEVLQP